MPVTLSLGSKIWDSKNLDIYSTFSILELVNLRPVVIDITTLVNTARPYAADAVLVQQRRWCCFAMVEIFSKD